MMAAVVPTVVYILVRSSRCPDRAGGEGPIVRSSSASRAASDRAAVRRCRGATRLAGTDRGHRAWQRDGEHGQTAHSEAGCRGRLRAGRSWRPERAPCVRCLDEDKCRSRRPWQGQGRKAARAIARVRRVGGSGGAYRPAIRSGTRARPSARTGSGDRRWAAPTVRGGRS